jgi:bifunctional non-homologous end joining protein LigD
MGLQNYHQKRDFRKTPEPRGKIAKNAEGKLPFVVHKHAATRLHYDFRLEMAGMLASWAVPKGPSLDPKQRRLAVEVEDHPLDYGGFEGTIPAGEYGAGAVIIWDRGYWVPEGNPLTGRQQGKLKFQLFGEKLRGGWTLVRIRNPRQANGKNNWLLIKDADDSASNLEIVSERPESVKSGRAIEELNNPRRPGKTPAQSSRRSATVRRRDSANRANAAMPKFVEPQLATLVTAVPDGQQWLHELKFDGYRIFCRVDNGRVTLLTRNAQDWTGRFGALAQAAKKLDVRQALLDGEVVAVQNDGSHSFQLLQNSLKHGDSARLIYYAFDLLHLDGRDLRSAPLLERKELLQRLLPRKAQGSNTGMLRYSEHWLGQGAKVFDKACEMGLEGIIAKRTDASYQSGRGKDWLKIKCSKSQEFVIGGFTDPAGSRVGFGALLLGVHDDSGALRYVGRVGTGFDDNMLRDLRARLDKLERKSAPFVNPPKGADAKGAHWVEPTLVGEVVFTEWTTDGILRHPSFKGLREDKPAAEIGHEVAAPLPPTARSAAHADDLVGGVKLTNPDRVLYPDQGITKLELARYYEQITDWILPHVEGRPLTLLRCPAGHRKQCFYQRHTRDAVSDAIRAISAREKGATVQYISVDALPGLIALVQMGVLELHTWGSRAPHIERPDRMTFDLDPGPNVSWDKVKAAAAHVRARLRDLDLGAFVKTTGGKGLHVVVPIAPEQTWEYVKDFSRLLAESLVREAPDRYTATMSKTKRHGKIFIDYLRNSRTATAVCAYSTRARPGATVSVPLRSEELTKDLRGHFNLHNVPARLARLRKDPWHDYEAARRALTAKLLRQLS